MRGLHQFEKFDLLAFLLGKELTVTDCRPWADYDTQKELGTKVEVAITKDATAYAPTKDGRVASNLFEKFSIKVPKTVSIPIGTIITIVNGNGAVYGEKRNQLSVRAEDVKIVPAPAVSAKEG